jgi:energy-coupling factor transporter ATP-binding protein EcfA2
MKAPADLNDDIHLSFPYPGLRPFRSDDSGYFFGRDVQIREIVARLRTHRFVAIIGGSGSGKSSLVLAGAIPRLRAFAIKEAGDIWIPIVSTPGTNHVDDTPIERLARKFCNELESSERNAERIEECAALLRQKHGFGLAVDRFGGRPKDADGLDLNRADVKINYLFLIDQFEELFHPSNVGPKVAEDCRHLANRVIEQFQQQHAHVCVALTMRSEHLNDCARYEDLPDAINGSSYLVKRLSGNQLREAIEQPAVRYAQHRIAEAQRARRLRKLRGGSPESQPPLPDKILFEEDLLQRLLQDSNSILGQPDHADQLPLLQHLLFWIWRAASARCLGNGAPDKLTKQDLCIAVNQQGCDDVKLTDSVNTLEACLENRCEAIFNSDSGRQSNWAVAFRCLAFKEPNSGCYTQQRMSMRALRAQLNLHGPDAELLQYFIPWLQPHGYLHLDKDSQTVKVAHETLIRRWLRLRKWTDEEDRQFQVYLRLLEDCGRWEAGNYDAELLSGSDTLRRYDDARLSHLLADETRTARFARLLAMDRDGERLSAYVGSALTFLTKSRERQTSLERERERVAAREKQFREWRAQADRDLAIAKERTVAVEARAAEVEAKNNEAQANVAAANATNKHLKFRQQVSICALALLLVGIAVVLIGLRRSSLQGSLMRSYGVAAETQLAFVPQFDNFEEMRRPLKNVLKAAHVFVAGQRQVDSLPERWPFNTEGFAALRMVQQAAESRNVVALRTVLQGAPWKLEKAINRTLPDQSVDCTESMRGASEWGPSLKEARFFPHSGAEKHGLIVLQHARGGISMSIGRVDTQGGCSMMRPLYTTPVGLLANVGVAINATHFIVEFPTSYQFHLVLWNQAGGPGAREGPRIVRNERDPYVIEGIQRLHSVRQPYATDFAFGERTLRFFDTEPSLIDAEWAAKGRPMQGATSRGFCERFAQAHGLKTTEMQELPVAPPEKGTYCLHVSRAKSSEDAPYIASLYRSSAEIFARPGTKPLPIVDQVVVGNRRPTEYRIDRSGNSFAFKSAEDEQWRAVPCSLDAWRGLAKEVFDSKEVSDPNVANENTASRFTNVHDLIFNSTERAIDDEDLAKALPNPPVIGLPRDPHSTQVSASTR